MKLATDTELLERMSLDPTRQGNISSANSALLSATSVIEGLIRTTLVRNSRIDYYQVKAKPDTRVHFYLTQGFLDVDEAVSVYVETEVITDVTTLTPLDAEDYYVDYVGGFVAVEDSIGPEASFVAISYTAGFNLDDDEIALFTPVVLKEAALTAATRSMHSHSASKNKKDYVDFSSALTRQLYQLTNPLVRVGTKGLTPLKTEIV